jgi:hypothetical protein
MAGFAPFSGHGSVRLKSLAVAPQECVAGMQQS